MIKNRITKINLILTTFYVMFSCEDPSSIVEPFPIAEINFDYLQWYNKLFISARVSQRYMNSSLDSVEVLWNGTDANNTYDTLRLYDDGMNGDILAIDNIFSRKVLNSDSIITNVIPKGAKDSVFLSIQGMFKDRLIKSELEFFILGNIRPSIDSITYAPVIEKPLQSSNGGALNTIKFTVSASVFDANGYNDVKRVFFRSYHVEKDSMMNNGAPILLLDDGYKEDSATGEVNDLGDKRKNDSTYSRIISISEEAIIGTYHWIFEAQDKSNAYSDTVKRTVVVK